MALAYDQYLLRTELDALWRRGRSHEQRGRNLLSFRTHMMPCEMLRATTSTRPQHGL